MTRTGSLTSLNPSQLGRTEEERAYYAFNEKAWAMFAPFYDLVTFPMRKLRGEVVALAGLDASSRVLDVATGTGAQARAFANKAGDVVGIDLSEAMLRIARRERGLPNLMFRRADAAELPFDDASFDVACISFALHEMPASIRERVIGELVRVTRPGGTIIVVDYAPPHGAFECAISRIVALYERERYEEFIQSDLHALLRRSGIEIRDDRRPLLGTAQVVIGSRVELS